MPSDEHGRSPSSAAAVGGVDGDDAAPPVEQPQALLAWQLRTQASACAAMGSPLYAHLLRRAAEDIDAGGPAWGVLASHAAPGRGDALALRFMAAVHRLVLTRRAPALALHYPSVGGRARDLDSAWASLRGVLIAEEEELRALVRLSCQTNEVGRAAALVGGYLAVAASVWGDQVERFARLRGALRLAADLPVDVDRAPLDRWTADQLAEPAEGVATVLTHSVVEEYLPGEVRARFRTAIAQAGERATAAAPLAWLRLEPITALRSHGLTLTTWPGGGERVLARSDGHGNDVRWHEGSGAPYPRKRDGKRKTTAVGDKDVPRPLASPPTTWANDE